MVSSRSGRWVWISLVPIVPLAIPQVTAAGGLEPYVPSPLAPPKLTVGGNHQAHSRHHTLPPSIHNVYFFTNTEHRTEGER